MDNPTKFTAASLENRFKNAWQFLKETQVIQHLQKTPKTLNKLPWYLLIGASGSGKTQLVRQAELKLMTADHLATNPRDESEDNKHCNFWFSDEATIIDVPGNYIDTTIEADSTLFLTILKKYTSRKPLAGILVAINLAEWAIKTKAKQQQFSQQLKQTLQLVAAKLNASCPLYLIFTHIDCINGFNEFFAELGYEEREQPWGVTLNANATSNLATLFKTNYDRLLKRLHERVIWRLQHERNAERRAKIQGFPLQMESLREGIANCLYQLSDIFVPHGTLTCEGIYFVSNLQNGTIIDCLHKSHNSSSALVATPTDNLTTLASHQSTSAYFSHRLFKKIIFDHPFVAQAKPFITLTRQAYWAIAGLVLLSIIIMAFAFSSKTKELNNAQIALAEYRESIQNVSVQDHDLNHNLIPLKHLQDAVKSLRRSHLPWLMAQGLRQPKLQTLAENTYQSELNIRFLPSLGTTLEQTLATSTDPHVVYGALKVYLMLGTPAHYDHAFIQTWLNNYWQESLKRNPALQTQLNEHLTALLTKPIVPLTLNQAAITQARNTLNNTDPVQLAYAILKNHTAYTLFNPLLAQEKDSAAYKEIFPNLEHVMGIASIYTANQFQTIYFHQIKDACEFATQGDWVIGKKTHAGANVNLSEDLIKSVQTLYLKNYAYQWQTFLNSLQIPAKQDLKQLRNTLNNLSGRQSPLIDILKIVANNTALIHLLPPNQPFPTVDFRNIQANLVAPFNDLNHFTTVVEGEKTSGLNQTLVALHTLQDYTDEVANAHNSGQAAFKLAKRKFTSITQDNDAIDLLLNQAQTTPQPIQSWLNTLANNSWYYVLQETEKYLTAAWQTDVVTEYNAQINNHYPIFKNAKTDMTLEQFTHFFGPTGTIHNYFVTYLAPFVDTSTPTWQWRTSHDGKIGLNNNFLMQLERAAIIKTMFFDNKQQLQVNFSLRLQSLGPEVKQFEFKLNDQNFADKKWNKVRHAFTWPALNASQMASITFTDSDSEKHTLAFTGPWALFKILDKSSVNADEESDRRFKVTFDLNGLSARYDLVANDIINPFMPNIISEFRCPTTF